MTLDDYIRSLSKNHRNIAFAGISKNSGKTTALNFFSKVYADAVLVCGVVTIGRDGEDKDEITQQPKPKVKVYSGSFFIGYLQASEIEQGVRLVKRLNRDVGLFQALHQLEIAIHHPGSIQQVKEACALMQQHTTTNFIDGAFDRKAHLAADVSDGVVLSVGAYFSEDLKKIKQRLEYLHYFSKKKVLPASGVKNVDVLTDDVFRSERYLRYAVKDYSKVFLSEEGLRYLKKSGGVFIQTPLPVCLITINPYNPAGKSLGEEELMSCVKEVFTNVPVANIYTQNVLF